MPHSSVIGRFVLGAFFVTVMTLGDSVPPLAAEKLPVAVIAVLDAQRVLNESRAGRDIHRQVDAYRKAFQSEIKKEEAKLRDMEEELKRQRAILAPAVFEKRRRDFETRVLTLQRRAQSRSQVLKRSFDDAMRELRKPLLPLVRKLTARLGYNVVVDNSQVLMVVKGRDITETVIERLNEKVPSVKVAKPTSK